MNISSIKLVVLLTAIIIPTVSLESETYIIRNSSTLTLVREGRPINLIPVPDVYQSDRTFCGHSALRAVLSYYNYSIQQMQVSKAVQPSMDYGIGPKLVEEAFNILADKYNYTGTLQLVRHQNMTTQQLEESLAEGHPVVVLITHTRLINISETQSYRQPYAHWMPMTGMDDQAYYLQDSLVFGTLKFIPKGKFVKMWHGQCKSQNRDAVRVGIVIRPKKDKPINSKSQP